MNKPHKHAELIKAWADGAEIDYLIRNTEWRTTTQPAWDQCTEYRIKKNIVKTVGYRRYYYAENDNYYVSSVYEDKYSDNWTAHVKLGPTDGWSFVKWIDKEWQYDEVEI